MSDCIGTWVLLPELCFYSNGTPPESGRYEIGLIDGRFVFGIQWVAGGEARSTSFSAPADSEAELTEIPGLTHVQVEAPDPQTLDSSAFAGEDRLAFARRRVSNDGQLLSVFQTNQSPDGPTETYQVYKRV